MINHQKRLPLGTNLMLSGTVQSWPFCVCCVSLSIIPCTLGQVSELASHFEWSDIPQHAQTPLVSPVTCWWTRGVLETPRTRTDTDAAAGCVSVCSLAPWLPVQGAEEHVCGVPPFEAQWGSPGSDRLHAVPCSGFSGGSRTGAEVQRKQTRLGRTASLRKGVE